MAGILSQTTKDLILSRAPTYLELMSQDLEAACIRVIADDFLIYCERNLMILDKSTGELVPLKMNWAQERLVYMVMQDIADGKPVRYIVLKARQLGLSTIIEALGFWWTTTHRNIKTVIIAHEKDAATALYEMFKRYFDNAHPHFKPDRKYNNKQELVFDVDDQTKEEYAERGDRPPGLASSIRTMVADEGKGRGQTIHFFHGSEVAFWKVKADMVSSAMQAIPMRGGTFAFLESTANGVGGFFYKTWQRAKRGESNMRPVFFAWHEHNEYEIHSFDSFGEPIQLTWLDEEEEKLFLLFETKGYPRDTWDAKIRWRREKKKEFLDDPKKFYQEYPSTDMEAFLASGRPKFSIDQLVKMENYVDQEHIPADDPRNFQFGNVIANPDPTSREKYLFVEAPPAGEGYDAAPLKVWEHPIRFNQKTREEARQYTIGVDVSEGKLNKDSEKKENDYSVVTVMRKDNNKVVARWRGHIDPDLLGAVVYALGTYYNEALVGVEVNNHGLTVVQSLRNKFYRNLYMRETNEEHQFQERTAVMGWRTDKKTKPIIINNLATAIREGDIIELDVVCIRECMTYVVDDQGHTNAQEGQFDDCVMSLAIALEMTEYNSIDSQYAKDHIHKPIKRNKHASTANALDSIARPGATRSSHLETLTRRRAARAAHKAHRRDRSAFPH